MTSRELRVAATAGLLALAAACSRPAPDPNSLHPAIALKTPEGGGTAYVEVSGLDGALDALRGAEYSAEKWTSLLRVSVAADAPPVLGNYAVADDALRFTPQFPFDAGRKYEVRFDPAQLPGMGANAPAPVAATVGLPASTAVPTTVVERIYPTADVVPENQLRMYVQFSAPMGLRTGINYMKLIDDNGKVVDGAFLPLDYEFWNADRTRFTVFFDPGRVKEGILPNEQMGRPLKAGHAYTLVVSEEWRDGNGLPLKEPFHRSFRAGPADMRPLDPATWRIEAPEPGTRRALVVNFPEPLDHGLLMRALGVRFGGKALAGDVLVATGETRWMFAPREPWRPGNYELLALSILEDLAGNQIGRPFEVDNFERVDPQPDPTSVTLPFVINSSATH